MGYSNVQVSSFAANKSPVCQNAQNLLIVSAISINTDEKQGSYAIQVKDLKVLTKEIRNDFIDYRSRNDRNNGLLRSTPC